MGRIRGYLKNFDYFKQLPIVVDTPGEQSGSFQVSDSEALFFGVLINTNGTDDATVVVYDNPAETGTVKWRTKVAGGDHYGGGILPFPIPMDNGIYVALTGTGASYIPFYLAIS